MEWWLEGGASFMSAWAGERLWGEAFGRSLRGQYLASYSHEMAYLSSGTLDAPNDVWENNGWKGEWTLIYYYGALVWEQLRLKVGDEALESGLHDFFQRSSQQPGITDGPPAGYAAFIQCLERYTSVDVASYLAQWTSTTRASISRYGR
jgi:hypothetical protein